MRRYNALEEEISGLHI